MNQAEAIEEAKTVKWAKWVAQDRDGTWWAFETEPVVDERGTYYGGSANCCELGKEDVAPGPKIEVTP